MLFLQVEQASETKEMKDTFCIEISVFMLAEAALTLYLINLLDAHVPENARLGALGGLSVIWLTLAVGFWFLTHFLWDKWKRLGKRKK